MAVFRVEKTKDFTIMSNHHLRNTELSLKAKGLLSLMLSLPEDWDYTTKGLAHICKDGVDSITTALKELERHGYLTRQRLRYDNGQLGDIECCDHAMSLRNGAWFYCRHSEVAETLPCHGVRIKMADLEQVVFETIRAQMCPALGIDSNKDKLDLQTVQQAEHEEKLRSIQDSKRHLYEQYALGEIDLETYRTRKAVYDTELVQAKNVHAVITAQTKQIKSDYEIKLKQQEIVQEVGNANMLTKALIDRLINKVYVFPGDRIEIEYATQDFLETKESEKEV